MSLFFWLLYSTLVIRGTRKLLMHRCNLFAILFVASVRRSPMDWQGTHRSVKMRWQVADRLTRRTRLRSMTFFRARHYICKLSQRYWTYCVISRDSECVRPILCSIYWLHSCSRACSDLLCINFSVNFLHRVRFIAVVLSYVFLMRLLPCSKFNISWL